ncbi:hypothetical protein E8E13_006153 [Curvularia kusanoi]|uniref:DUF7580 domain-containing protein n=1 Tax=Curvularia kusanoi TaxID=90978 RepID=A0A9P4T9K7_CURKU|nr:hypothetical protein E8E13_006153 [Curvularia kusanoi]
MMQQSVLTQRTPYDCIARRLRTCLVSSIESYNEGLEPIKAFMRWDKELPQCIRKLRSQHVHFAQTIRILLEPITSDVELAEMMLNPGSAQLWKDEYMVSKLQARLQESYHAYQGTIADIERITKQIASKLDLDRAKELTRNDLEALLVANPKKGNDKFEFKKRIRFGMSKKTIKALLEELNACNRELERFTEKSEKIETYRKAAKPSFASRLQRIQNYARSVHTSICWSCKSRLNVKKTSFRVSFSSLRDGSKASWSWQPAEISVEEEEDELALTPMSSPKPRITKSVSFSQPPPYSINDPGANWAEPLQEVEDIYTSEKLAVVSDAVSLEDLLNRRPSVNGKRIRLSKKERYNLALTLASSVLYLNSTPWLANHWAAKDIKFLQAADATNVIDTERPYLGPVIVEPLNSLTPATKSLSMQNKNTVLLALAVALLELYFGTTAESYQESEHGACDPALHQNPWMLCAMAHQWTEESQDELSAAFLSAVRHCLRCFSDPGVSLQDPEFLQAAAEGIVLPLQEELYQFLGKSTA